MVDLSGKVALVTGSSRGIGRGCAIELARAGADVAVNYRSHAEEGKETAQAIRDLGRSAIVVGADVSDRASVESMANQAIEAFGKIDILVANAAMSVRQRFLEATVEDVEKTIGVCMWGVFHVTHLVAQHLAERGEGGKIVIISSVHSFRPFSGAVAYNMSKAAINNMAYTVAGELAEHRINVNVIEPGWTDTPGERKFMSESDLQAAWRDLPLGKAADIADIGKAAVFLSSPEAGHITGANLRVDGGEWIPSR